MHRNMLWCHLVDYKLEFVKNGREDLLHTYLILRSSVEPLYFDILKLLIPPKRGGGPKLRTIS